MAIYITQESSYGGRERFIYNSRNRKAIVGTGLKLSTWVMHRDFTPDLIPRDPNDLKQIAVKEGTFNILWNKVDTHQMRSPWSDEVTGKRAKLRELEEIISESISTS